MFEMILRVPPVPQLIVPGSTPVISFGNALVAEVATLGINPSHREFLTDQIPPALLEDPERRLATLASLGAGNSNDLSVEQALTLLSDWWNYFHRNPYEWFNHLNELMRQGLGNEVNYYNGVACHLDLVQ
jgi:hypothetical protein